MFWVNLLKSRMTVVHSDIFRFAIHPCDAKDHCSGWKWSGHKVSSGRLSYRVHYMGKRWDPVVLNVIGNKINRESYKSISISDGTVLPTNRRQRVYSNGTLVIEHAQRQADAGTYTCQAQNRQKHTARRDVEVQVIGQSALDSVLVCLCSCLCPHKTVSLIIL